MVEKIVEMFTPEMIAIAIISLTALALFTFLMVLILIGLRSRLKKRLLVMERKSLELAQEQAGFRQDREMMSNTTIAGFADTAGKIKSIGGRLDEFDNTIAGLAEAADKIESIERRLDECDSKIAESQNQLTGHTSKLNEHDTLLAQAGQMMGKETADFNQALQRIHILEQEFQGLKGFQRTFEQIRNRIVNALGAIPAAGMPPQNTLTTEQKDIKQEAVIPSEEKLPDTEDPYKFRTRYP